MDINDLRLMRELEKIGLEKIKKAEEPSVCPHCGRCPVCGKRLYDWPKPPVWEWKYYETTGGPVWYKS